MVMQGTVYYLSDDIEYVFPNNHTTDVLPNLNTLQSASHIILESYTDGILSVHSRVILKVVHYKTGKLMAIRSL